MASFCELEIQKLRVQMPFFPLQQALAAFSLHEDASLHRIFALSSSDDTVATASGPTHGRLVM